MASKTRLNKEMRDLAIAALVVHATSKIEIELARRERDLAFAARDERMTDAEKALLAGIPERWLRMDNRIYVAANGWQDYLHFNVVEKPGHWHDGISVRLHFTQDKHFIPPVETNVVSAELAPKIQAFMQDKRDWAEKRREIQALIKGTVQGFQYVEALLLAVPELKELAPGLIAPKVENKALVTTAERMLCAIAQVRGDEREGCCDGKRVADLEVTAEEA